MQKVDVSDRRFQMDALDGLRGFAALLVVFSHCSNIGMHIAPGVDLQGAGKTGVFLFFLLSSFLLTLPLLSKGRNILTQTTMAHYWKRRFLRIYPLYTVYLLICVVTTWGFAVLLKKPGNGIPFPLDWSGFLRHLALLEGRQVTWSIAVEFKFYFILPFLACLVVRLKSNGYRILIPFFVFAFLLSQVYLPQSDALANDTRLLPYAPLFLAGVAIAVIQSDLRSMSLESPRRSGLLTCLGFAGAVGVIITLPSIFSFIWTPVPLSYFHKDFLLYSVLWSMVLLSAVNVPGVIQSFFSLPLLRFYGAISFGLYLFHPVFILAARRFGLSSYSGAWFILVASTAVAYLSLRFLERPIAALHFRKQHDVFRSEFSNSEAGIVPALKTQK